MNSLNIRRKIPKWIKKPIRPLYHKWSIKIDNEMINDLMEYFSLTRKEVLHYLKIANQLNNDFWYCLNIKTEEEINKFYEDTPFYIFNLIFWHSTKYQRKLRSEFIRLIYRWEKALDYGAGVGDLCLEVAKKGLEVDYADLQGKTFNFAKWLFSKRKYNIPMINLSKDEIEKKYDIIFCIDVIEHVKNPKALLRNLINHLNNNGRLVITGLNPIVSKEIPLHFKLEFKPEEYLNSLGMIETDRPFLWIKSCKELLTMV